MKPKVGDVVMVTWIDALSEEGWNEEGMDELAALTCATCKTVGKVNILTDRLISLAQSWGESEGRSGNIWHIPVGMVLETEVLWPKDRELAQMEQAMWLDPTGLSAMCEEAKDARDDGREER